MNTLAHNPDLSDQVTVHLAESLAAIDESIDGLRAQANALAAVHGSISRILAERIVAGMVDDPAAYATLSPAVLKALGGDFARATLLVHAQRMGLLTGQDQTTIWYAEHGSDEERHLVEMIEATTP